MEKEKINNRESCYRMTDISKINESGKRVYQIQATKDLPKLKVKEGDLGGWIEHKNNLIGREVWLDETSEIFGNAKVTGVDGIISIVNYSKIYGNTIINGLQRVFINDSYISGDSWLESMNLRVSKKKISGKYKLIDHHTCKLCNKTIYGAKNMLMLKDELWKSLESLIWHETSLGSRLLCPECMEEMLQRELNLNDLMLGSYNKLVPCNILALFHMRDKKNLLIKYINSGKLNKSDAIVNYLSKNLELKDWLDKEGYVLW